MKQNETGFVRVQCFMQLYSKDPSNYFLFNQMSHTFRYL